MNTPKPGFTRLELCVVIFIIGILMSLLLPAINSTGCGGARAAQCRSNINQMMKACFMYEIYHKTLPPGGWANGWAGDPNLGHGETQPGGWMYTILPMIEQQNLHKLPPEEAQKIPLRSYHCPSRRIATVYPTKATFFNSGSPDVMGKTDYAGNGGDGKMLLDFGSGAGMDAFTEADWQKMEPRESNGVFQRHAGVPLSAITDGHAQTYLLGEKYLRPEGYETGEELGDDHGWNVGFDDDIIRFTKHRLPFIVKPARDAKDLATPVFAFGGPHKDAFHMAMVDGSVRRVNFSIAAETHANLGIRNDGVIYGDKEIPEW